MKRKVKRSNRRTFLSTVAGFGLVAGLSLHRAAGAVTIITQKPLGENSSGSDGGQR
jgi:hypothetical protein